MCQKVETVCCHCGELLFGYFIACNAWRVDAKQANDENAPFPLASQCEYPKEKEIQPLLSGCPNNDSCPSWFANLFRGYGEAANETLEVRMFRDQVAQEKYNEWKENFARKYFVKKPIVPRQVPEGFWYLAAKDFVSEIESVEPASTASSYLLDSEPAELASTVSSFDGGRTDLEALEAIMQSEDQQNTLA
ncbi:hypothetical protein FPOAC2_00833 [Fusarium poae]|uniref:Uncharacterized protein n=1 Tax=Fusarium poae TaxID=36050 RepID=A0A1B8B349_FUSPO|nr:hypothetical protein FPOAC1_000769 [Fusarium poae]KAG8674797.1 hypothetical protein FPOAC1_000769 [Fusarium poae]OBS27145.1 hypothetical protein FPOA_01086 [Fusarium poae]